MIAVGRPGGTSGKGGRNHRLNWTDLDGGGAEFAGYLIACEYEGTTMPWVVRYRSERFLRWHGEYAGYLRFKTVENAKRWVERRIARMKGMGFGR